MLTKQQQAEYNQLVKQRDAALQEAIATHNEPKRYSERAAKLEDKIMTMPTSPQRAKLEGELAAVKQKMVTLESQQRTALQTYSRAESKLSSFQNKIGCPLTRSDCVNRSLDSKAEVYLRAADRNVTTHARGSRAKMKEAVRFMEHHKESPLTTRDFARGTDFSQPVRARWSDPESGVSNRLRRGTIISRYEQDPTAPRKAKSKSDSTRPRAAYYGAPSASPNRQGIVWENRPHNRYQRTIAWLA